MHSAGFALFKKRTYGGFLGKGVSGKKEIQTMALDDPDLKPLWREIAKI